MNILKTLQEKRAELRLKKIQKKLILNGFDAMSSIINITKEIGIDCSPFFGTLLGAYRENDFIPYDDDIDLTMDAQYLTKELMLILRENGFVLHHLSFASDFRGCILSMRYEEIVLEIYFHYNLGTNQYLYIPVALNHSWNYFEKLNMFPIKEIVTPRITSLTDCKFQNGWIRIPQNSKEILMQLYGPDFMTPIKKKKGGSLVVETIPFVRKRWSAIPIELVDEDILSAIRKG